MLVGDEAWGWGGYGTDEMEARAAVFPPRLPAVLEDPGNLFVHDAYQMYNDAITNISRHCQNVDFIDRGFYVSAWSHCSIFSLLLNTFATYEKRLEGCAG